MLFSYFSSNLLAMLHSSGYQTAELSEGNQMNSIKIYNFYFRTY